MRAFASTSLPKCSDFAAAYIDMTAPFWPLSVVTGALMFAQQKLSPQAQDPQQQAMMYMMPVMFMLFTLFLPSGLTLYILTNTLLSMGHQFYVNRQDAPPTSLPPTSPNGPKLRPA